jgi:molybdopterin-guanine dinucleotide biosynthesis protein A
MAGRYVAVVAPSPVPVAPFAAAILTGGRSRRMGADKAFVTVDGVAMVDRVAGAVRTAGASSVVAVGGDLARLRAAGLRAVADPHQGAGPLGGLLTALEAAGTPVLVVVATDLAWLSDATVRALVVGLTADPTTDVAAAVGNRREPLCAAWRPERCVAVVRSAFAGGERAVHRVMAGLAVVDVAVAPHSVRNANHPDDLRQ